MLKSISSETDIHCCLYVSCRTIFTRANRHNYSDPDYSYTDEEMAAIEAHRKHYQSFIDNLREERREKVRVKEHKEYGDDLNIGVKVWLSAVNIFPKHVLCQGKITQDSIIVMYFW